LEHLKHEPLCSFWKDVCQEMDMTGASMESATSSMTGGRCEVCMLTFRNCQLAGFKAHSYQGTDTRVGRHKESSLVEFEHLDGGVSTASIGLVRYFCMLSAWSETEQSHLHIVRFAAMTRPVTQTHLDMGGVNTYTMVMGGNDSVFCPPIHRIVGPVIVLIPDPSNVHGNANTWRLFSTPGKHGIL
jgi:hypothetical protein